MIKPNKVYISTKKDAPDADTIANRLVEHIGSRAEVSIGHEIDEDADLVICVGGDGTILRALHAMSKPKPILGVNIGLIGFLADISPDDAPDVIDVILNGFETEVRSRLATQVNDDPLPPAMNEAVVLTSRPAHILHFRILVDGVELDTFRADGVVFATPTGSTAYAMSAGGPIVDPRVDAIIIVPLAPFKLSARPVVVPADSDIQLELIQMDREGTLVIDGQFNRNINREDIIRIAKSDTPALFVKTEDKFLSKLRNKLAESRK